MGAISTIALSLKPTARGRSFQWCYGGYDSASYKHKQGIQPEPGARVRGVRFKKHANSNKTTRRRVFSCRALKAFTYLFVCPPHLSSSFLDLSQYCTCDWEDTRGTMPGSVASQLKTNADSDGTGYWSGWNLLWAAAGRFPAAP